MTFLKESPQSSGNGWMYGSDLSWGSGAIALVFISLLSYTIMSIWTDAHAG